MLLGGRIWLCFWFVHNYTPFLLPTTRIGDSAGGFIGTSKFLLLDADTNYAHWFFQFVFSATAATIVSGSVAERVSFEAYLIYSVILTAFVYPVGTHWGWSHLGWLEDLGFYDFSGAAAVHSVGGAAALGACYFLGPRVGRFNPDGSPNPNVRGHSTLLTALGGMVLWVGFLAFNGGSTLRVINVDDAGKFTSIANLIAKVIGATIMAGTGGMHLSKSLSANSIDRRSHSPDLHKS